MKVLAVSTGAAGAYFCGRLQQGGAEVAAVLRSDYDAVKANGFEINADAGTFFFHPDGVYHSAAEYPEIPDYIIVTAKVLPWIHVPELIRPAVRSPETVIVLMQNGIGIEEETAKAFPQNEILSGVMYIGATRQGHGKVRQTGAHKLILGRFGGGDSPAAKDLLETFAGTEVETLFAEQIAYYRWKKLLWNTPFNTVSVLGGGLNTKEMCDGGALEKLCRTLMEETAAVAASEGIVFSKGDLDGTMEYTRNFPAYKTSMLVDYEAGRPLEVDAILGNPCKIAERSGIPVPCLKTCLALLRKFSERNAKS